MAKPRSKPKSNNQRPTSSPTSKGIVDIEVSARIDSKNGGIRRVLAGEAERLPEDADLLRGYLLAPTVGTDARVAPG